MKHAEDDPLAELLPLPFAVSVCLKPRASWRHSQPRLWEDFPGTQANSALPHYVAEDRRR